MELVCYSTSHLSRKQETKISKELFGYVDRSQHGKYVYERPGFLTGKTYQKVKPGCFLIGKKHLGLVVTFLKERKANVEIIS